MILRLVEMEKEYDIVFCLEKEEEEECIGLNIWRRFWRVRVHGGGEEWLRGQGGLSSQKLGETLWATVCSKMRVGKARVQAQIDYKIIKIGVAAV